MSERKRKDKVVKVIFDRHGNPEVTVAFNMPNGEYVQAEFIMGVWNVPPKMTREMVMSAMNSPAIKVVGSSRPQLYRTGIPATPPKRSI
jgi:hypothetical protein